MSGMTGGYLRKIIIAPTTLLSRQHTKTFTERFRHFPLNIGQASRMVTGKELAQVKQSIAEGEHAAVSRT